MERAQWELHVQLQHILDLVRPQHKGVTEAQAHERHVGPVRVVDESDVGVADDHVQAPVALAQGDGHGVRVDRGHEPGVLVHALRLVEEVEQAEHERHVHESLRGREAEGSRTREER